MFLKKAALIAGAAGALMAMAPAAHAGAPLVIDGGQNVQWCGNIDVDSYGDYQPQDSPNFVKCTQVPTTENHPVKKHVDP